MNTPSTIFFSLLQRAVGENTSLPQKIDADTWQKIYELAKQQALLGIVFFTVDTLTEEQRPPKALMMQWWGMTERIKQQSKRLNEVAEKVEQRFAADGLRGVVLKGVGMAALYPHPLNRTPGDVDLWLESERKAIVEAIRYVDKVVFQTDMEKVRPVKELGADAVFVGSDWKGTDAWNQYEKDFA